MNSWLPSMMSPVLVAIDRAMDTASVNANNVTATVVGASCCMVEKLKSGADSGGKPAGISPTRATISRPSTGAIHHCNTNADKVPHTIAVIM